MKIVGLSGSDPDLVMVIPPGHSYRSMHESIHDSVYRKCQQRRHTLAARLSVYVWHQGVAASRASVLAHGRTGSQSSGRGAINYSSIATGDTADNGNADGFSSCRLLCGALVCQRIMGKDIANCSSWSQWNANRLACRRGNSLRLLAI